MFTVEALLAFRNTPFMRWKVASSVAFVKTSATMQLEITSLQATISLMTAYLTKVEASSKN